MNPKDEMKVFVEGLSKKLKNQYDGESELGPNNSEACRLMDALQNTIDTSSFPPEEDDEGAIVAPWSLSVGPTRDYGSDANAQER